MSDTFEQMVERKRAQTAQSSPAGTSDFDALLARKRAAAIPQVSSLESLGRGALQGATLGFADEITGGLEAILKAGTEGKSLGDAYRAARDESRHNFDAAKAAHPNMYLGGELGGGVVSGVLSGGVGAGLRGAAALGGAAGLGNSTADVTRGEIGQAAGDTAKSAALGAATFGALKGAGALGRKLLPGDGSIRSTLADYLAKKAELRAVKSLGGTKGMMTQLREQGLRTAGDIDAQTRALGRTALDKGIVTIRGGADDQFARTAEELQKSGVDVGDVLSRADAMANPSERIRPEDLARLAEKQVIAPLRKQPAMRDKAQALWEEAQAIASRQPKSGRGLTLSKIEEDIRRPYATRTYRPLGQLDRKDTIPLERMIEGEVEGSIGRIGQRTGTDVAEQYARAKGDYSKLSDLYTLSKSGLGRSDANRTISLTDTLSAGTGLASGGPGAAVAAGALNRTVRTKGDQLAAVGFDKLSKLLLSPQGIQLAKNAVATHPEAFPELATAALRGDQALLVAHAVATRRSPEYRERLLATAQ